MKVCVEYKRVLYNIVYIIVMIKIFLFFYNLSVKSILTLCQGDLYRYRSVDVVKMHTKNVCL